MAPDRALLQVHVVEVDDDQRAAFARCGVRVDELVPHLLDVVADEGTVTTGEVRVNPDHESRRRRTAARCALIVDCTPSRAAAAVSAAMADGVDWLNGPHYSVRDPAPLAEALLADAVTAARREAERLAEAAERSLGAVLALEEFAEGHLGDAMLAGSYQQQAAGGAAWEGSMDFHPGSLTVAAAVRVTFVLA